MIILLCGRDQCGLNVHSVDPDSMRIESWSSADRPKVLYYKFKQKVRMQSESQNAI